MKGATMLSDDTPPRPLADDLHLDAVAHGLTLGETIRQWLERGRPPLHTLPLSRAIADLHQQFHELRQLCAALRTEQRALERLVQERLGLDD